MKLRAYCPSRLLTKAASGVLTSLRGSTYGPEYDSPLCSLRPCWTAFLNSLRAISIRSVTVRGGPFEDGRRVCQHTPSFAVALRVRTPPLEGCPSGSLIPILTKFGSARSLSPRKDLLIPVNDLVDDHSTVDTTPGMNLRGRTGLYDDAIVRDCEPVASLAIHHPPPDRVLSPICGSACGIPGAVA